MPDRVFHPLHDPPTVLDRFLAHGPSVIISIWSAVMGVALLVSAVTGIQVSPSIFEFPKLVTIGVGVSGFLGGLVAALNLLRPLRRVDLSWAIEQSGWWLAGAAWACYGVAVLWSFPASVIAWGTSLALALCAATRIIVLYLIERTVRSDRERVKQEHIFPDGDAT